MAFAFLSSTTVRRVTSSARAFASSVAHGVSVLAIALYGTDAAGSKSPVRNRMRSAGPIAASTSAAVKRPIANPSFTVGATLLCNSTPLVSAIAAPTAWFSVGKYPWSCTQCVAA